MKKIRVAKKRKLILLKYAKIIPKIKNKTKIDKGGKWSLSSTFINLFLYT